MIEVEGAAALGRELEALAERSAILDGQLPPQTALPSCRRLARQLGVARNTVVLAYQHLVDEGYLLARERSGYYVNEDILVGRVRLARSARPSASSIRPRL